jgi:hypothetical protein
MIDIPPPPDAPPLRYSSFVFIQDLAHSYVFRNSFDDKPTKNKSFPPFGPEDTADVWYERITVTSMRNGIFVPPYATLTYGDKMGSLWKELLVEHPHLENFAPIWSATIMEIFEASVQGGRFTQSLPDRTDVAGILRRSQGDGYMALYLFMQHYATQLNPPTESKVNTREPPRFTGCKSLEEYTARFIQFCRQRYYLSRHVYACPELHEMYLSEIPGEIVGAYKSYTHWGGILSRLESWTTATIPPEMCFKSIVEYIQRACVSGRVDYAAVIAGCGTRNKVHELVLCGPTSNQPDDTDYDFVQATRTTTETPQCSFCNRRHDHAKEDCERLVSGFLAINIVREDPSLYKRVLAKHGSSLAKIYQPFDRSGTNNDRAGDRKAATDKVRQMTVADTAVPPDTPIAPAVRDVPEPIRNDVRALRSSPALFMAEYRDFMEDRPGILHSLSNVPVTPHDSNAEFRELGDDAAELLDADLLEHMQRADILALGDSDDAAYGDWSNPIRNTLSMTTATRSTMDTPPWAHERDRCYYAHMDHGATISVVTEHYLVHRLHGLSRPRVVVDVGGHEHPCTGAGFIQLFSSARGDLVYIPVFLCPTLTSNIISPAHFGDFLGATGHATRIDSRARTGSMVLENVRPGHDVVIEGKVYDNLLWAGPMIRVKMSDGGPPPGSPWLKLEKLRAHELSSRALACPAVCSLDTDGPFHSNWSAVGEDGESPALSAGEDPLEPNSRPFSRIAAVRTRSFLTELPQPPLRAPRWSRWEDRQHANRTPMKENANPNRPGNEDPPPMEDMGIGQPAKVPTSAVLIPEANAVLIPEANEEATPIGTDEEVPPGDAPATIPVTTTEPPDKLPRRRLLRTLLHQRLGHIHLRRLSSLHKSVDGIPAGLPDVDVCAACPICISNKMHRRAASQSEEHNVTELYEGLSMDLGFVVQRPDAQKLGSGSESNPGGDAVSMASMATPLSAREFAKLSPMEKYKYQLGIHGEMGYLLIRDHFSGAIYGTTIQSKSPPIDFLRRFFETHSSTSPRRFVRLDHGRDLGGSKKLQGLLSEFGYSVQLTAPDSPHQNGMIERVNQDAGNFMRTALNGASLAPKFWPYAFYTFLRVYNVLPHNRAGFGEEDLVPTTPFEVVMGKRPDLSNFRTFGCRVWVRPPGGRKKKLIDNTRRGRFLGFKSTSKNCLYLDEDSNEVREAFHVRFDETFNDMVDPPPNAVALRAIANGHDFPVTGSQPGLSSSEFDTSCAPSLNPTTVTIPVEALHTLPYLEILHDPERDRAYIRNVKGGTAMKKARSFWKKLLGSFILRINGRPYRDADEVHKKLVDLANAPTPSPVTISVDPEPYLYTKDKFEPSLHLNAEQLASIHALRVATTRDNPVCACSLPSVLYRV